MSTAAETDTDRAVLHQGSRKSSGHARRSGIYAAADHAKASPRWRYREIDTTHMVASNRPDQLAGVLQELH